MAFDHNFSVGQPDNLVYVHELLNQLEEQLDKMVSNILKVLIFYPLLIYTQLIIEWDHHLNIPFAISIF